MNKKITLIGCGILREETEYVLQSSGLNNINIKWLEVGLHDNIERLEKTLDEAIQEQADDAGAGKIKILYGGACLPWMRDFAKERQVPVLPVKNCLGALVGDEEIKTLEENNTLVASTGWVRQMWLGRAETATGWKADDFRLQFGRYDLILVLDPGINSLTDEEIITCFDLVQVPLEIMPCDFGYFKRLLLDFIA